MEGKTALEQVLEAWSLADGTGAPAPNGGSRAPVADSAEAPSAEPTPASDRHEPAEPALAPAPPRREKRGRSSTPEELNEELVRRALYGGPRTMVERRRRSSSLPLGGGGT